MSAEQPEPSSTRRYVLFAMKIAVSVILLAILFSRINAGRLWASARRASLPWLLVAIVVNFISVLVSAWRWHVLLRAQDVRIPFRTLLGSILVGLFFNNFLPSNIGGDVIRIRDTARLARSKTMATTVILVDRVMGLMALVLVAATGATLAAGLTGHGPAPIWPSWLWGGLILAALVSAPAVLVPAGVGRLLQPLTVFHPEWVSGRIGSLTAILERFRDRPSALAEGFVGAIFVQAATVLFFVTVAHALGLAI
jgi:glycosyltransferase 2 family protein